MIAHFPVADWLNSNFADDRPVVNQWLKLSEVLIALPGLAEAMESLTKMPCFKPKYSVLLISKPLVMYSNQSTQYQAFQGSSSFSLS
jgi:hypothetical protein